MVFIRKYRISILAVFLLIILSFFKPPSIEPSTSLLPLDKIVHFLMYFGVAGVMWFDYLRGNENKMKKGYGVALLFPIVLGGAIELVQEYATSYRGGEWGDFLANSLGAVCALFLARYVLMPFLSKYKRLFFRKKQQ